MKDAAAPVSDFKEAARSFLAPTPFADAALLALAGDASSRRYYRLRKNDASALLMHAPPAAESAPCPPDAAADERRRLGYNAMARLAGANLTAFSAIAAFLREKGLAAPQVYALDRENGFALIEDFGDDLFARVATPQNENELYAAAIDALTQMRERAPSRPADPDFQLLDYDSCALRSEAELLIDWYWREKSGAAPSEATRAEFAEIFGAAMADLSAPHAFVHRDFHAENLIWRRDGEGAARVGLIDFQDGLFGCSAYDVVSLLEDARRDVSQELAEAMIARYKEQLSTEAREAFDRDYALLAAQRNMKILGVFARLARRDGKLRYLSFMPRVEAHIRKDLARPPLQDMRAFLRRAMPSGPW